MRYERPTPEEIKRFRGLTGLTQTQFGEMLYCKLAIVQHWEAGIRNMPASTWELANLKLRPLIEMRQEAAKDIT
jgi:DNA-binding transcriptional regulator YiaG